MRTESINGSSSWPSPCSRPAAPAKPGRPPAAMPAAPVTRPDTECSRHGSPPDNRPLHVGGTSTTATLVAAAVTAVLVFHRPSLRPLVADGDAVRHADQLPVGKHGAGRSPRSSRITSIHPSSNQRQLLGCRQPFHGSLRSMPIGQIDHGEGGDGIRPDDAALVMVLFDGSAAGA